MKLINYYTVTDPNSAVLRVGANVGNGDISFDLRFRLGQAMFGVSFREDKTLLIEYEPANEPVSNYVGRGQQPYYTNLPCNAVSVVLPVRLVAYPSPSLVQATEPQHLTLYDVVAVVDGDEYLVGIAYEDVFEVFPDRLITALMEALGNTYWRLKDIVSPPEAESAEPVGCGDVQ